MARTLSKSDFGINALFSSVIALGTIFCDAGISMALIQNQKINDNHKIAAFQGTVALSILIYLILVVFSSQISFFLDCNELSDTLKFSGVIIFFNSVNSISRAILQKEFLFKSISIITLFSAILNFIVGVIFALRGYGFWSIVYATFISSFLNFLFFLKVAPVKISLNFHFREWVELFKYGSGIIFLGLINYIATSGINFILAKNLSISKLGVFERSNTLKTMPADILGNIFSTILFPTMSKFQESKEDLVKIFHISLGVIFSILSPITLFLVYYSNEVVQIVFGSDWVESVILVKILFLVIPFSASNQIADTLIRSLGMVYKNVIRKSLFIFGLVTSILIGLKFGGLTGVAIGIVLSFIINFITMLILISRILSIRISDILFPPVISGIKTSSLLFFLLFGINYIFTFSNDIVQFAVVGVLSSTIWILIQIKVKFIRSKHFQNILDLRSNLISLDTIQK